MTTYQVRIDLIMTANNEQDVEEILRQLFDKENKIINAEILEIEEDKENE